MKPFLMLLVVILGLTASRVRGSDVRTIEVDSRRVSSTNGKFTIAGDTKGNAILIDCVAHRNMKRVRFIFFQPLLRPHPRRNLTFLSHRLRRVQAFRTVKAVRAPIPRATVEMEATQHLHLPVPSSRARRRLFALTHVVTP